MTGQWEIIGPIVALRSFGAYSRRWVDALWGYDVFIAHRRKDAVSYAEALRAKLSSERISTFIDRVVYRPGDSLVVATRRHVRKSTQLVLVGSPELLAVRQPTDWVEREISEFLESNPDDPKLVLLDIGDRVAGALAQHPVPTLILS